MSPGARDAEERHTYRMGLAERLATKLRRGWRHLREEGLRRTLSRRVIDRAVRFLWEAKPAWTPRRLWIRLEEIPIDRPIFVLGTQGGGLTLLTRMIRRHPDVVMVGSNARFWAGSDEMDKHFADLPDDFVVRSPAFRSWRPGEPEHPVFGHARSWLYAIDELLPAHRRTADDHTPEKEAALEEKIASSIRAYAPDPTSARFLDMSQSYALKVPLLRACLPGARFVLLSRNPWASCWRETTTWEHRYVLWKEVPPLEERLELAAQHWENTFRIALGDLEGEEDGLVARFEDLIEDPERVLRRVLGHVGLDFRPRMLPRPGDRPPVGSKDREKWWPIRSDVNDRYLEEIPPEAAAIVTRRAGEVAARLGYEPPGG